MPSSNKIVDDLSRVLTGAAGVAQGALNEAETKMKSWTQKWVSDQDYVTRDEFNAVAEMAKKARSESAALRKELDALKAEMEKPVKTAKSTGKAKS